ncbi:peptidase [Lysobacter helvus]|uniref:Peptidase n=2 Tax=Lysobacteraceae TaxID=32033 RepID=A0ABM7Q3F1_9GAMM|nr:MULTISPECIES: M23 family metallopeptidase [Lysobacter]BCT91764.1 peptidase [Lysobacter caseinilyticus]BCT94917.1 peptidase [Lysobacter helvus]
MSFKIVLNNRGEPSARLVDKISDNAQRRPGITAGILLSAGLVLGLGASVGFTGVRTAQLQAKVEKQQAELDAAHANSQREINALAARLGELQAQANRLNALGERLTRAGQLQDGEFDFDQPVPTGGAGPVRDMPRAELNRELSVLEREYTASGQQLSVMESLLFNRTLDRNAIPSRDPIANSYITSGFGGRADPIVGGHQFHKGIDFKANVGDPVLAVADGVVSFSGVRSGYGNVVEIDHGNGYVTRYAHNSRLLGRVGDLVRAGQQIAKAGSTGRSTGAHVHFEVWDNGRVVNPRQFLGGRSAVRG